MNLTWYTTHGTIDIVRKVPEDVKTLQVNRTLLLVQLANSPPSADTGQLQHSQFNCRTVQNLQKTQTLRKCARKLTRVLSCTGSSLFFSHTCRVLASFPGSPRVQTKAGQGLGTRLVGYRLQRHGNGVRGRRGSHVLNLPDICSPFQL